MIKIAELVTTLIEMDKKIESLQLENNILKNHAHEEVVIAEASTEDCECDWNQRKSVVDDMIYDYGLKYLFDKTTRSWQGVNAKRNKDGKVEYTPYKRFVDDVIRKDEIPETISKKELVTRLDLLLTEKYKSECNKAYVDLLEKEEEESEEE